MEKSHFTCFDFQKITHCKDVFCTPSRLLGSAALPFTLCAFGYSFFCRIFGFTKFKNAKLSGKGRYEYNGCVRMSYNYLLI